MGLACCKCSTLLRGPGEFPPGAQGAGFPQQALLPMGKDPLDVTCIFQAGKRIGLPGSAWMFVRYSKFIK